MGHETTAVNVGCKVLPICDAAVTPVASKGGDSSGEKEAAPTSERRRAVARVKQELLRWAAAAKSGKGGSKAWKKVLYSRHKLKPEADSPEYSTGKVSFKWDAGSCSGASSVCSPLSLPSTSTTRNDHSHIHTGSASRLSFACEKPRHGPTTSTSTGAATGDEHVRNGQWITTDSEFVVLEL